jgi:polyphosphate kinase
VAWAEANGLAALETEWSDVETMLRMPDGKITYYWLTEDDVPGVNGVPGTEPTPDPRPLTPAHAFIRLEDVIRLHLADLFPGMELGRSAAFRLTRDSEYEIDDEVDDLLEEIEAHVKVVGQKVRSVPAAQGPRCGR